MYKFINLTTTIILSKSEKRFTKRLNKLRPTVWDRSIAKVPNFKRGNETRRVSLKDSIRARLKKVQGEFCIYCACQFDSASTTHIEHIAPKKDYVYFTFEPLNLVLACQRCNIDKKRTGDYLVKKNRIYKNCTFNIVHPYLDDLDDHIEYTRVVILSKTIKGQKTISEFELNEERLLVKRGLFLPSIGIPLTLNEETLIKTIMDRVYYSR